MSTPSRALGLRKSLAQNSTRPSRFREATRTSTKRPAAPREVSMASTNPIPARTVASTVHRG